MRRATVFIIAVIITSIYFSITLTIGIYDDYPLVYVEEGKAKGLYVDLLSEIARLENWNIRFVYYKWRDIFKALAQGKIDAIAAIAETKERGKVFLFNKEAFVQNWGVVVGRKPLNNIFDLQDKRLALGYNDVYSLEFIKLLGNFRISSSFVFFDSYEEELLALQEKRADAAVISRLAAVALSSKYKFHISSLIFKPVDLKLAFRKDSKVAKVVIPVIDRYLLEWKLKENSFYWKSFYKYFATEKPFPQWVKYLLTILIIGFSVLALLYSFQRYYSKKLKTELETATRQLRDSSEELQALNEELESSYRQLENAMSKSLEILESVAQIANKYMGEEEFLQKILELAIDMLEPAKYGAVFMIDENGQPRMVASVGHDKETFNSHTFKKTDFFLKPEKPMIIENILEYDKDHMDPEDYEILKKSSKPIKETLIVSICFKGEIGGTMVIDIPPNVNGSFTEYHAKVMDNFSRIVSVFLDYRKYLKLEGELHKSIILILVKALDFYSPYTKGHSERVAELSAKIAEAMDLPSEEIKKVYWAGILHDVGKIFVLQEIINKPGKLTDEEFEIIKQHPVKSYELVREIKGMEEIAKIVRHHHERWDGKGYPDGLKGEEIPLEARIIAVADAYDAMTSERPYRSALTPPEALEEIMKESGTQFDPQVVNAFVKAFQLMSESA